MEAENIASMANFSAIQSQSSMTEIQVNPMDKKDIEPQGQSGLPNSSPSHKLHLSSEGKLHQAIDAISDQVDSILMSHLSPAQEKELANTYQEIDKLFAGGDIQAKDEHKAEQLFEKVHNILDTSFDKLSEQEHQYIDGLSFQMDKLTQELEQQEMAMEQNMSFSAPNSPGSLTDLIHGNGGNNKKSLSVAELNSLSAVDLNKLPASELKKLNANQLNKLNTAQLNLLEVAQLKMLSQINLEKLNPSQQAKLGVV